MIEVTPQTVSAFLKDGHRHKDYAITVDIADHLQFHFDGFDPRLDKRNQLLDKGKRFFERTWEDDEHRENPYFDFLITCRRPGEDATINTYRKSIYKSLTKRPCNKVVNTLKKIVRNKDWKIDYSESEKPSKIPEGEQLEDYTEKKYPFFRNVTSWLRGLALRKILLDPNALIVTIPTNFDAAEKQEFFKPFSFFVPSIDVYDFVEGEHCIYKSNQTTFYNNSKGVPIETPIFYIINRNEIWQSWVINDKGEMSLVLVLDHQLDFLPVVRAGGDVQKVKNNTILYKSFIDAMLPDLDVAAREVSDEDAEVVKHVHSTMWYFSGQRCTTCNGTGSTRLEGGEVVKCTEQNCSNGMMKHSPYDDIVVDPPKGVENTNIPIPPAGYVTKDTEMVKIMADRIKDHIANSLGTVNMEFLAQSPLNQSGKAKEVDQDAANNFVFDIAYHLVINVMDRIYFSINEFRNYIIIPDADTRKSMLPRINIPKRFDIISEEILADKLKTLKEAGVSATITDKLQIDISLSAFPNDPNVSKATKTVLQHDPFSHMSVDQKNSTIAAGEVNDIDAVLTLYINDFVTIATNTIDGFLDMDFEKQREILVKMAAAKTIELPTETPQVDGNGQEDS